MLSCQNFEISHTNKKKISINLCIGFDSFFLKKSNLKFDPIGFKKCHLSKLKVNFQKK